MKNTNDSIIKRYTKKVIKRIPNAYHARLKIELQNNLFERFHDIPNLTESMIHESFGTPEHFATEYLSGMDAEELQTHLKRSKMHKRILIITLVCLIVLLIPVSIWIVSEGDRHVGYYYADDILDHDTQ